MDATHLRTSQVKPNHQVLDIDIDAILNIQQNNAEGLTTEEWADQLGVSALKMRAVFRKAVPDGQFEVGRQVRRHYTGRMIPYIVYKWVG